MQFLFYVRDSLQRFSMTYKQSPDSKLRSTAPHPRKGTITPLPQWVMRATQFLHTAKPHTMCLQSSTQASLKQSQFLWLSTLTEVKSYLIGLRILWEKIRHKWERHGRTQDRSNRKWHSILSSWRGEKTT